MTTKIYDGLVNTPDYLHSGVDPQTGTFSTQFCLATPEANNLLGPDFPICLTYSPLNQKTLGVGKGWKIPATVYNEKKKILATHDGALYELKEADGVLSTKEEQFSFKIETTMDYYKIVYNTGDIELISRKSNVSGKGDNKVCTRMINPEGYSLYLDWDFDKEYPRLSKVRDEKITLCEITYTDTLVCVMIFPNNETEKREFNITLDNDLLTKFADKSLATTLTWKLGYTAFTDETVKSLHNTDSASYLTSVAAPSGSKETVVYTVSDSVYRVTKYSQLFGDGNNVKREVNYTYLGSYLNKCHLNSDSYNTVKNIVSNDFYRTCFAEMSSGNDASVIAETFNHFNLSVYKKTIKGAVKDSDTFLSSLRDAVLSGKSGIAPPIDAVLKLFTSCQSETEYLEYNIKTDDIKTYKDYVNLPLSKVNVTESGKHIQTHTLAIDSKTQQPKIESTSVTETTKWTYDTQGNIIKRYNSDGSSDTFDYYPAAGEKGKCPADSSGFICRLKKHVFRPRSTPYTTPDRKIVYTYTSLPVKTAANTVSKTYTVLNTRSTYSDSTLLHIDGQIYTNTPDDENHGCLSSTLSAVISSVNTLRNPDLKKIAQAELTLKTALTQANNNDVPEDNKLTTMAEALSQAVTAGLLPGDTSIPDDLVGRIALIKTSLTSLKNALTLTRTIYSRTIDSNKVMQKIAVHTWDGLTSTSSETLSCFTGLTVAETDSLGNVMTCSYDKLGRPLNVKQNPDTEYESSVIHTYDILPADDKGISFLQVTSTDEQGIQNRITLDSLGRERSRWILDPDYKAGGLWKKVQSTKYDNVGRIIAVNYYDYLAKEGDDGKVTEDKVNNTVVYSYTYTNGCYVIKTRDGQGRRAASICTVSNLVVRTQTSQTTAPAANGQQYFNGAINQVWFDISGNVIKTEVRDSTLDSDNKPANTVLMTTTAEYDGNNLLRKYTDADGNITILGYDNVGRLISIEKPDGSKQAWAYDTRSLDVWQTGITLFDAKGLAFPLGAQTFDGLGRPLTTITGGRTHTYGYAKMTTATFPSTVTMPSGKAITRKYDACLGNVLISTSAENISNTYTYDKKTGYLLSDSDSVGNSSTLTYTKQGFASTVSHTSSGTTRKESQTYSLLGRPMSGVDVSGTTHTNTYDTLGHLTATKDPGIRTELAYDLLGRVYQKTVTAVDTGTQLITVYGYDTLNQVVSQSETLKHGESSKELTNITLTYTKSGQLATRNTTFVAKSAHTLTVGASDVGATGTTDVSSDTGSTSASADTSITPSKDSRKETYRYDTQGRLTACTYTGTSLPQDGHDHSITGLTYTYDIQNNLTSVVTAWGDAATDCDTATFTYGNAADPTQLTLVAHSHDSYPANVTFNYDASGCRTNDSKGNTLAYDALNRLHTLTDSTGNVSTYQYDAHGKLAGISTASTETTKNTTLTGTTKNTTLFFNGPYPAHEFTDETNTRFLDSAIIEQSVAVTDSKIVRLCGNDGLRNLLFLVTSPEDVQRYHYSPFGESESAFARGFNGQYHDAVSGMTVMGERMYDPTTRRFTTPDSLSPFAVAAGTNPYSYCLNDPINRWDPTGNTSTLGIIKAIYGFVDDRIGDYVHGMHGIRNLIDLLYNNTHPESEPFVDTMEKVSEYVGYGQMTLEILYGGKGVIKAAGRGIKKLTARGIPNATRRAKPFEPSILRFESKLNKHDVVLHRNFRGGMEMAYETHGSKSGKLMNRYGKMRPAKEVAQNDIAPILRQYNYPPGDPLYLVACWGGKSGAAQTVARALGRPVYGYSRKVFIHGPSYMNRPIQRLRGTKFGNQITHQRSNMLWRSWNWVRGVPNEIQAVPTIYYP